MVNPYALADARMRRARTREGGWRGRALGLLPLLGVLAALPLVRDTFYGFLGGGDAAQAIGAGGAAARIGLTLAGAMCLDTYAQAVRGPDRGVIDVHPLLPTAWGDALVRRIVRGRVGWLALAGVALAPLQVHPLAFATGAIVVAGAWVAGLGVGLAVNLAAPLTADAPAWAPLYDALRGANPRMQAALLYAPGAALGIAGGSVVLASTGMERILAGAEATPLAVVALLAPFGVGVLGLTLARRCYGVRARLPMLLGEIDALHAAAEHPEEAGSVYLSWTVRYVPAFLRVRYLHELRHLWRGQRGWVTGAWGLAVLAALAGWSTTGGAAGATGMARLVGGAGLSLIGVAASRLAGDDPAWLDAWLAASGRARARALALLAVMQPVPWLAALALAVRHGAAAATEGFLALQLLAVCLAALAAATSTRLRGAAWLVYFPLATLLVAVALLVGRW